MLPAPTAAGVAGHPFGSRRIFRSIYPEKNFGPVRIPAYKVCKTWQTPEGIADFVE